MTSEFTIAVHALVFKIISKRVNPVNRLLRMSAHILYVLEKCWLSLKSVFSNNKRRGYPTKSADWPKIKESKFVYFSDTMLALKELPRAVGIIGGGYIGLEVTYFYQNFGVLVSFVSGRTLDPSNYYSCLLYTSRCV